MTETLKRVTIARPLEASEETRQVAREALVVLRYRDLHDKIIESQELLSSVLRRLGIKPFDRAAVSKYQEEKRDQAREKSRNREWFYWRKVHFRDAREVPIFVLRKAMQIKLACPDAKLFVEQLERDPDPFLIAQLGRETFYIDVWDEKDFEAKL